MKALDLFCGAGGASMGLHRAGFDVTGIDIRPQPRYPFRFIQADATRPPVDLTTFDFIWASPPCQSYSVVTPKAHRHKHSDLIDCTRDLLRLSGRPYAIENVGGARHKLRNPIKLCGSMFGLQSHRHRWFECSPPILLVPECKHDFVPLLVTTAGANSRALRGNIGAKSVKNAPAAYDIDWMDGAGLREAIPPAYGEFIGRAARASLTGGAE